MLVQCLFVPGYFFSASTFCTVPLCLSSVRRSLITHEVLLSVQMDLSWSWRRQTLKINQFSWTPLLSRTATHGILLSRFLKSLKNLSKSPSCDPTFFFCSHLSDSLTPHGHCSLFLRFISWPILSCLYEVQWSTSSHWLPDHLCQESAFNALPKWLGLPMHYCILLATYFGGLQISHKT